MIGQRVAALSIDLRQAGIFLRPFQRNPGALFFWMCSRHTSVVKGRMYKSIAGGTVSKTTGCFDDDGCFPQRP